jgi:broad specificity phosphatase PhoE
MQRLWAALLLAVASATGSAAEEDAVWAALQGGGLVIVLRHAVTPAQLGDPPGFRLDDCTTQRNLTDSGIAQAERIGAAFRARSIRIDSVRSSRWCRCMDTARLAFGQVEPWPMLDALSFDDPQQRAAKAAALRSEIARAAGPGNRVLVTHNFNIQGALGITIGMGEALVLAPAGNDNHTIVGRIPAP